MDYNHMGDLISSVRKSKNMTQKELADLLHVTDKAVSKWERGISCPDIGTLPALADILGISTDELLRCRGQAPAENRGAPAGRELRRTALPVLRAVGLAMGVATLVLSVLGKLDGRTAVTLLSVGVTCIGIVQLSE
ncbi:XRE family transcriptional regulator [Anaerotruncus massiliensis (ex Liu et al. 2021)]|uniref:XRE family transcriptional regulator n=2 Tax=Anaerotruncus TaxID=244127 RepID=A0A498CK73_9FIRM|nr:MULTISPECIES: helix-turn-helix transcriptional regulator [Anaerotruncus]MBC3939687.1 helix-turn-helix transcriptional regulator [Anaerotruncus massiliensis (ex Togo et al. 2019)]RLL08390.1 XRE family transcriptional regulator [Anaerotruncus massiliensis (ex Liu et al. 2021)]